MLTAILLDYPFYKFHIKLFPCLVESESKGVGAESMHSSAPKSSSVIVYMLLIWIHIVILFFFIQSDDDASNNLPNTLMGFLLYMLQRSSRNRGAGDAWEHGQGEFMVVSGYVTTYKSLFDLIYLFYFRL